MLFRFTLDNDIEGIHELAFNPKGWEDTELLIRRDEKYIGLFFDYTLKLEFFCGAGKEYIDNIYDTQGIEALITILIEIDCNESGTFQNLYEGKLNLASYERVYEFPEFTRVNIEQAGIIQTIKNRLDTVVNLNKLETIDGTALAPLGFGPYQLNLHSKKIILHAEYSFEPFTESINLDPSQDSIHVELPTVVEIDEFQMAYPVTFPYLIGSDGAAAGEPNLFFRNDSEFDKILNLNLNMIGTLSIQSPINNNFNLILRLRVSNGYNPVGPLPPGEQTIVIHDFGPKFIPGGNTLPVNFNINYSNTITLNPTDSFWITFILIGYDISASFPTASTISFAASTFSLTLTEESETPATTANAFAVYEAGARIAQSIVDSPDAFRSHFLGRKNAEPFQEVQNGCASFMAITNGFQIRNFPIEDRPIYISMREYFDSLNALFNLGLGIEKSGSNYFIRIEPKEFFYNTETLFQIENIRNFTIKSAENLYINNIELGYNKWENEEINGLDEFNTKRKYTVKLKTVGQSLIQQCKFIASAYALEFTRRKQYINEFTEDWKYDNDNFLICLNRSVDIAGTPTELDTAEKDENFTNITNLISPETIYNLRLSPGRILRSWLKTIAASVIKANAILKDILFSYGEGNYKLTSEGTEPCDPGNQELINEGGDVELLIPNALDSFEPLYVPEILEFEKELSYTQYLAIRNEPTKCLEVSPTNSNFIKGFIQEIRYQPVTGIAQFKLLRAYALASDCSHLYVEPDYVECGYVE